MSVTDPLNKAEDKTQSKSGGEIHIVIGQQFFLTISKILFFYPKGLCFVFARLLKPNMSGQICDAVNRRNEIP